MDSDSPFLLPEHLWEMGKPLLNAPEDFTLNYRLDSKQEPATIREIVDVVGIQFPGDNMAEPENLEALLHKSDLAADLQQLVAEAYPDSMRGMLIPTR
jgi:hypothetical protein